MATPPPMCEQRQSCSILVLGKTGAGKSSLVNSIFGKDVCDVGPGPDAVTRKVIRRRRRVDDVELTAYDSPGFSDGQHKDDSYFSAVTKLFPELDLLVYCIRMDLAFDDDDREVIEACVCLKDASTVWDHSVIALTFANQLMYPEKYDTEDKEVDFFEEKYKAWKEKLEYTLQKFGVTDVPIVPTGDLSVTAINPNPRMLHKGCPDWISIFWITCHTRFNERGKAALVKVNMDRLRLPPTEDLPADSKVPLYLQSIYLRDGTIIPYGTTGYSILHPYWADVQK